MKRLLILNGMKRSGNHAFAHWVIANTPIRFYNNAVQINRILRGEAKLPEPMAFTRWLDHLGRAPFFQRVRAAGKDVLVSFEDLDPAWRLFSSVPRETITILLLRDPYNLFASRLRMGSKKKKLEAFFHPPSANFQTMIAMWKMHARAFLGDTPDARPDVAVYYNRWFASPEYRADIAAQLGMANSDAGLDRVASYGGGSSFDGQGYDARGREMGVLCRVEKLSEEEREFFRIVEEDEELRELHERVEAAGMLVATSPEPVLKLRVAK